MILTRVVVFVLLKSRGAIPRVEFCILRISLGIPLELLQADPGTPESSENGLFNIYLVNPLVFTMPLLSTLLIPLIDICSLELRPEPPFAGVFGPSGPDIAKSLKRVFWGSAENQKNVRNPNHHYSSKKYRNTPPICIAIRLQFVPQCFWCPYGGLRSEEREILSVLLPFVSQYASHLYCNTPPIRIAVLLGKSWWLWSPECSPEKSPKTPQKV